MKTTIKPHGRLKALTTGIGAMLLALASADIASAQNTKTGVNAGISFTTGTNNTADGVSALQFDTTGSANTAVGALTLKNNTAGSNNTAVGYGALTVSVANGNTALGYQALFKNTSGTLNTAGGGFALNKNTTGSFNTAFGRSALDGNLDGTNNVAVGYQALLKNTSGDFNVAIGDGALLNSTTGTGNIGIGEDGGFNLTVGSNNISIGNKGVAGESGKIRIGTSPTHTDTFLAGVIHGNGSGLTGVPVTAANFALPLTLATTTVSGSAGFSVANTTGDGISGTSDIGSGVFGTSNSLGVFGDCTAFGAGSGVLGRYDGGGFFGGGNGVFGYNSSAGVGVLGVSERGDGVSGRTNIATHSGVFGYTAVNGAYGGFFMNDGGGLALVSQGKMEVRGDMRLSNNSLYLRDGNDNSHGLRFRSDTDGPFLFGFSGGAVGTVGGGLPEQRALIWDSNNDVSISNDLTVQGSFLTVRGAGLEQAYLGGDGLGGDVQLGSTNANVSNVAVYNSATEKYMHLFVGVLHIMGGADVAEPFQMSSEEIPTGSVVVIDAEHAGRLKRSDRAYDQRVAGIVSGANGINAGIALHQEGVLDGGQNVALSGRVYVQANASNGPIQPGDLLTTSDTPGYAMKATDHDRAQGAIIGKAMSSLDEGTGMVLVLVTLQ